MALVTKDLSLDQAQSAIAAAVAKATELGCLSDIALVDAGANLKAFVRMDGALLGSIDVALKKARTARLFNLPSGTIGELSRPDGPLYGIEHSNGGLVSFGGGIPIADGDTVIGAIGVSGDSVENDQAIAQAGAEAIQRPSPR
ncbi:GlcG/HbpS family heme-binding protein [Thioalkalivibrio paradoxus]|uniref:GlcG/HbpS family heme-binding protein n=1 Tax=Thioalkalivibrio paradoxus TaxID=108010 RepID=UPI00022C5BA6|nr:heme-binding protein [Thioalkalivibrio paradoxus]